VRERIESRAHLCTRAGKGDSIDTVINMFVTEHSTTLQQARVQINVLRVAAESCCNSSHKWALWQLSTRRLQPR
jgi:hypothetical protein